MSSEESPLFSQHDRMCFEALLIVLVRHKGIYIPHPSSFVLVGVCESDPAFPRNLVTVASDLALASPIRYTNNHSTTVHHLD